MPSGESYIDLVSGGPIQTNVFGLNVVTSAVNVTLEFPADRIQRVNMTTASKQLRLPLAANYSLGQDFVVQNIGSNAFDVTTNDGLTVIMTAAVGTFNYIYLVSRTTDDDAQGVWAGGVMGGGGAQTGANFDITSLNGLTTPLSVGQGGTGLDGDVTGGTGQYVKQSTLGGAFTVATIGRADYPTFVGDSGSGGSKGAVPAPAAGDAAAQKYLAAGGGWSTPSGTGASASEPYVTVGNTSGLSAERALTAGTGLTLVDGGANSTVTLNVNVALPATSGNALAIPRVNSAATAIEYRTPAQTRADISAAVSGANNDITSLSGLTTPLSVAQGGTGAATLTANSVLLGAGTSAVTGAAPGTSGNVLTSNGTVWASATPAASDAGIVRIARLTPTAVASQAITGFNSTLYDGYLIVLSNMLPATDGDTLSMRTSTDGGSSYDSGGSDYSDTGLKASGGGNFTGTQSSIRLTGDVTQGNTAVTEVFSGKIEIYRPDQAVNVRVTYQANFAGTTTNLQVIAGSGTRLASADVDAVQVLYLGGNIVSGTIDFFGIRKAS